MNPIALALFVLWLVESPVAVIVSLLKLRRARRLRATTPIERMVVRRHIQRAVLGLVAALAFFAVGIVAIASILGVLPSTGGILISLGLDLALALIIIDSVGDLRL